MTGADSSVTLQAETRVCRKIAGFGEVDTDDSFGDENDRGSDAASPGDSSACGDDDAGSIHSSGSDARHELDFLLDQSGGLLSYLLLAS